MYSLRAEHEKFIIVQKHRHHFGYAYFKCFQFQSVMEKLRSNKLNIFQLVNFYLFQLLNRCNFVHYNEEACSFIGDSTLC